MDNTDIILYSQQSIYIYKRKITCQNLKGLSFSAKFGFFTLILATKGCLAQLVGVKLQVL